MYKVLSVNQRITEFFYRVYELVTTFDTDGIKNGSFSHDEDFKGNDLLLCRTEAEKYYWERLSEVKNGKYLLPFASPQDFAEGKHAAFSLTFSLIELQPNGNELEHPLFGETKYEVAQCITNEKALLKELGHI
jgi:hypothetical protein